MLSVSPFYKDREEAVDFPVNNKSYSKLTAEQIRDFQQKIKSGAFINLSDITRNTDLPYHYVYKYFNEKGKFSELALKILAESEMPEKIAPSC